MPQALPRPDLIATDAAKTIMHRIKSVKFGDGYEQLSPDGINSKVDKWRLSYVWMDKATYETIQTAFDTVGGADYFTWTPYGEAVSKRFKVDPDSKTVSFSSGKIKFSFSLTQVF